MPRKLDSDGLVRFMEKVEKLPDGCWIWNGAKEHRGYGFFWFGRRQTGAHRWAYQKLKRPIGFGLVIDHLCRNISCVNPEHMDVVSVRENVLRGVGITATHAKKTHCMRGHEFTTTNTYWTKKGRHCKECMKIRRKAGLRTTR